jgi:1-deoxy-D-xylulose-5-phosphate reductoisomerase
MKNICILGSTGSIGQSSLDVIAGFPDRFRVTYLTANKNIRRLEQQIARFHPRGVVVLDEGSASELRRTWDGRLDVGSGEDSLCELVARDDVDIVISSLVGFAGLRPTIEAIKKG